MSDSTLKPTSTLDCAIVAFVGALMEEHRVEDINAAFASVGYVRAAQPPRALPGEASEEPKSALGFLSCPFCGSSARFSFGNDGEVVNVRCVKWGDGCMGAGPNEYHRDKARDGWNRRAALRAGRGDGEAAKWLSAWKRRVEAAGDFDSVGNGTLRRFCDEAAEILARYPQTPVHADVERLDWIRDTFFTHKWNAVVGPGWRVDWSIVPHHRHIRMSDTSGISAGDFRAAIDAARQPSTDAEGDAIHG